MNNWAVTNVNADVIEAGSTIAVKAANSIIDPNEAIYWVAPPEYLGNKVGHQQAGPSCRCNCLMTLSITNTLDEMLTQE